MWSEFLSQVLGIAVREFPYEKNTRPSIGQKLLPSRYKQNKTAVVMANISVWLLVVALIVTLVAWLS